MNITFVGGGNMATALIGGLVGGSGQGTGKPAITVLDPAATQRERLASDFGVRALDALPAGEPGCEVLVLAVKPQQMREALLPLVAHARHALVISVAAGIRAGDLSRWLGGHTRIVRTMPNTPALIGAGITGLWADANVAAADRELAQRIVAAVGETVWVDTEPLLDAVTAVSGSGPAYVFYFMEAVEAAGRRLGLNASQARQLTLATFRGAAALASQSSEPPSVLRERVTSKGGTTAAALAVMAGHQLADPIAEAIATACRRGAELADEFGRDPAA